MYTPPNPDSDQFDIRHHIGGGFHYRTWLAKITEEERLAQKEILTKFGKDLPKFDEDGNKYVQQGYRRGLKPIPVKERSKHGRPSGSKDLQTRDIRVEFTKILQKKFLRLLAETGNIRSAAAETGISYGTVYLQMKKNPQFKSLVELAREQEAAKTRRSVQNRVLNGETTTEYDKDGNVVKSVHKPVNASLAIKWLESTQEEFKKRSESTHLHIGDGESDTRKHLQSLAQRLGVDMGDLEKNEKEIDIEGEYVEKD